MHQERIEWCHWPDLFESEILLPINGIQVAYELRSDVLFELDIAVTHDTGLTAEGVALAICLRARSGA